MGAAKMDDLSGKTIKSYELQQLIGKGGFGAVYRAYQPVVQRDVAIKVILPDYANNADFIRRFEAEAQLVARLEHLHIVPLYDFWREPDGAYLVMRWLRGGSLQDSLRKEGAWSLEETARLLDQIAAALTASHANGVIHRDMKPANILLDDEHNGYLTDFGIAKTIGPEGTAPSESIVGSFAYMSPEQLSQQPVMPQTDIYGLGIVLFEVLTGKRPFDANSPSKLANQHMNDPLPPIGSLRRDLPTSIDEVLQIATAKDALARFPDAQVLARAFRHAVNEHRPESQPPRTAFPREGETTEIVVVMSDSFGTGALQSDLKTPVLPIRNPYKGLRAFQEADFVDFFGREQLLARLFERLGEESPLARFLAVVGPSGSGKSSVARAGVIPALRSGDLPGSDRWFVADMIPGSHVTENLLNALMSVSMKPVEGLAELIEQDETGLLRAVHQVLPHDEDSEIVLVIDQFEEIFTQLRDEDQRLNLLKSLHHAVTAPDSRLRVIITLRADFYDRPLLYPAFGELMRQRTEVVLPLSPEELERAIVGPAERVGLVVENNLVAALIAEVSAEPGALPLLQYTLTEVFEQRDDKMLTLSAFYAVGGALGALAQRAEDIYLDLTTDQQALSRQLFLRLVTPGEGAEDTRRRIRWAELLSIVDDVSLMQSVLDIYGGYRLLTFDNDPETREPTIEIAHEALIRRWQRLRGWLDEGRADLQLQRRVASATAEWLRHDRDASFLASGMRLQQFEQLLAAATIALSQEESDFIRASVVRRQAVEAEQEAIQQREEALQRRARQRLVGLVIILSVSTLVAIALTSLAVNREQAVQDTAATAVAERERADLEANLARSRELSVRSITNLNDNEVDFALLFSLAALDNADTVGARSSLLAALQRYPYLTAMLHGHADRVRQLAFASDGKRLASISRDSTLRLWDVETRQPSDISFPMLSSPAWSIAISPDDARIATGSRDGSIQIWDAASGEPLDEPLLAHTDTVYGLAFSPDGTLLASASADSTVIIWDVERGEPVGAPLTGHADVVWSVAFHPDGNLLASGSQDGAILIWDVETREPIGEPLIGHRNWVLSVAFNPQGNLLASGSADQTVILWSVDADNAIFEPAQQLVTHTDWIRQVNFHPDGEQLAAASADGTLSLWDVASGQQIGPTIRGHRDAAWSIVFSPDGHTFASGGEDHRVLLWDLNERYPLGSVASMRDAETRALAYTSDGEALAIVYSDNTVVIQSPDSEANLNVTGAVSAAFHPSGSPLAIGDSTGAIQLWDAETGEIVDALLTNSTDIILSVAFNPDGTILASGSPDGSVILWDMEARAMIGEPLIGHEQAVSAVEFSPDGRIVASGGQDNRIILWDVATGEQLHNIAAHSDQISSIAFHPDGTMLASASWDNAIKIWDVATGELVGNPLEGHTDWVMAVAFSPDGTMLASGSQDANVILWDVASQQSIGRAFTGPGDGVNAVAFNPNNAVVTSGDLTGTVIRWETSIERWRGHACQISNREFSAAEREQFQINQQLCNTN